jgi:hypothetical protein
MNPSSLEITIRFFGKYLLKIILVFIGIQGYAEDSISRTEEHKSVPQILRWDLFGTYIQKFNTNDEELYAQYYPNNQSEEFLKDNIPLFECPDKQLEETYYFRWWTYRKHIQKNPEGFVITEFLPKVAWSGKYNTICCAASHHIREGRWLHDPAILNDYEIFWLFKGGSLRTYSFPIADAVYQFNLVHPDKALLALLYPKLKENLAAWENERKDSTNMFWQDDGKDGMEVSISGALAPNGSGYRATINSNMYADALALSKIAKILGIPSDIDKYKRKAEEVKSIINSRLWNEKDRFYEVIPKVKDGKFSGTRELHGFTPWYFNIPPAEYSDAWKQLMDTSGFYAPYGPTTAERRSPHFAVSYKGHECQWNGPGWPFATSITLTALANLLNDYNQSYATRSDYFKLLNIYNLSHRLKKSDGTVVPWIDENLNPFTGDWLARTRLKTWKNGTWDEGKGGIERGKDYNHSTFCDLIISGLIGIRVQEDSSLIINPLLPVDTWDYFCLDQVSCKNHMITVLYDKNGERYQKGKGFMVYVDGKLAISAPDLCKLKVKLIPKK